MDGIRHIRQWPGAVAQNRGANGLLRGAGLHRLEFPVEIDSRHTTGTGVPFALSGLAWLGSPGGDWLGPWFPDPNQPLVIYEDNPAVTEARRAIDALGETRPAWRRENAVTRTKRDERTLDQRLAMLKHALFGLASPAEHGDSVAAAIKWDRETALAVIAGVAALAACGKP